MTRPEDTVYCVQGFNCDLDVPVDGCTETKQWLQTGSDVSVPTWTQTEAKRRDSSGDLNFYYLNGFAPGRVIIQGR